jgi:tRNA (guanosine-2'-O-)-methyltransferase
VTGAQKSRPGELQRQRRRRQHGCWDHLIAAPLWVAYEANLGTLLRTCDAVGACLAVPGTPHYRQALARGDTLPQRSCIHWISSSKYRWLNEERQRGSRIVAVELAEDATRLADLPPARQRTVVLLGHEHNGVPLDTWPLVDEVVEIPMIGQGASLNVAVAGSLILYRLAGLS